MTYISRRTFLKGMGVAAVAAAATGVLGGCSLPKEEVTVHYYYMLDMGSMGSMKTDVNDVPMEVLKYMKKVDKKYLPEIGKSGWKIKEDGPFAIDWETKTISVEVEQTN